MWKDILTDPRKNYDPNNFIFLVRGILSYPHSNITLEEKIRALNNEKLYHSCSLIGKLNEEQTEKVFNTYSFQVCHLETFASQGLILTIPRDDVVQLAYKYDIGSPFYDQELMPTFIKNLLPYSQTPKDLLVYPIKDCHNEVIIKGDKDIKIVGIYFLKELSDKECVKEITCVLNKLDIDLEEYAIPFSETNTLMSDQINIEMMGEIF